MSSIGVPLPHIAVTPAEPMPRSSQPAAPNADEFRAGLYDARRELMRARAAALPFNFILGGFESSLAGGTLHLTPGIAQVRVPVGSWSTTDPQPVGKLYAPAETPSAVLSGALYDGAYRAERRTPTIVSAGDGTTGPATGDSIVYLTYDGSSPNRLKTAWHAVSDFSLDTFSVPVAWVRVAGGLITMVRDLRPMPPWRPRCAQRVYAPVSQTVVSQVMLHRSGATLIPVDLGSFWLEAGQALLVTASLLLETNLNLHAHEGVQLTVHLARGTPGDGFAGVHFWTGPSDGAVAPAWTTSFMNVGRNWFGATHLFAPLGFNDPDMFAPMVVHLNGLIVDDITPAWSATDSQNNQSAENRTDDFLGVRMAYLKAELVDARKADDLFAVLNPPASPKELPSWGEQSFPTIPAPDQSGA